MGPSDILSGAVSGGATGAMLGAVTIPGIGSVPGALVGALVGAGAGLLGWLFSGDASPEEIQATIRQAQEQYGEVTADTIRAAAGDVLGPTKLSQIETDPKYRQMQNEALGELDRVAKSGGMTAEDRANFNDALARSAQQQQQLRQSTLQGLQSRGLNSSGAETALLASGAQGAANAANMAGTRAVSDAANRRQQAIMQRAGLAGQIADTDWNQKAKVASAQDIIDQLNFGHRQTVRNMQMGAAGQQYGFAQQNAQAQQAESDRHSNQFAAAGQLALGTGMEMARSAPKTTPKKTVTYTPTAEEYGGLTATIPPASTPASAPMGDYTGSAIRNEEDAYA